MNRQTLLSRFHFDAITHWRVRHEKLLRQTAFFKATQKELVGQTAFLKALKEGFLKPNAKTAFFKAILKHNKSKEQRNCNVTQ